jgi:hypothetical protein
MSINPRLYPSWIEIPAADLDRALAFYRAVFQLTDTPLYEDGDMLIRVLWPSDKVDRAPGVSLVKSPLHHPPATPSGPVINFHLASHADLQTALEQARAFGGKIDNAIVDMGDGVKYVNLIDSEGNRIALSSYEEDPKTF